MDQPSTSAYSRPLNITDLGDDPTRVLIRDENRAFKFLATIPVAVIQISFQAALFVDSICVLKLSTRCANQTAVTSMQEAIPKFPKTFSQLDCSSVVIYSYMLVWILTLMTYLLCSYLQRNHRNVGYLILHERIHTCSRIPLITMCTGGFLLLAVLSLQHDGILFNGEFILNEPVFWFFLQVLTGLQFLVVMVSLSIYIAKVREFNLSRPVPDIFDATNVSSMPVTFDSRSIVEIGPGVQQTDSDVANLQSVCERQGDMIKYLRRRCDVLCERLYQASNTSP